jgi:hypothetical protein
LKIDLRIEYLSGDVSEVTAQASDLVAFEDKYNISVSKLETEMKFSHLLFLAWHASKRAKLTDKVFEEWIELVSSAGVPDQNPK